MTPAAANERKPRARTGRPNGSRAPAERARPKALAIPKAKRDEYLDRVANGEDRAVVANDLGCTGRLFRSLARNDPDFARRLDEAIAEGKQSHADQYTAELRQARRHVALIERNPRTLHYESIAYDPDYRAAHQRHQLEMTGPDGGPLEVQVAVEHTPDQVAAILGRLQQLGLVQPGPRLAALAQGQPLLAAPAD